MKKLIVLVALAAMLAGCGSQQENKVEPPPANSGQQNSDGSQSATGGENAAQTITYLSEDGPIEVPEHPQRIVVLTRFLTGNVMSLGVPLVGVDEMSKDNPNFASQLQEVEAVSDESLEKIMALEPDLIIGMAGISNVEQLSKIAPTVLYTYGKVDFYEQQIEVGKLLNKEQEARAWVDRFKEKAERIGDEIRAKIGEEATVSVIETFNKQLYVYGYKFGRGTEILYDVFKLKLPQKVQEATQSDGFLALSTEVLGEYSGDYIIFSKDADEDNTFQQTETYKHIDAVKNNRVFEADAKAFYFNDPLSMEYQLDFFTEHFLGASQ